MWTSLSHIIIKFRILLIVLLAVITIFMAYKAKDIEMSFDFVQTVPDNDPDMIFYKNFKELFGEDGNLVAVGIKDSAIYQSLNFRRLKYLSEEFASLNGVNDVISLPLIQRLKKNTREKIFELEPIFSDIPEDQHQLDSLLTLAKDQKFYSGQIINEENGALLILVSINKEVLNSKKRIVLTKDIIEAGEKFSKATGLQLHYAGLPFVRSVMADTVKKEMSMFLILSVLVTGLILLFFFRAWNAVVFPMVIIGVVIIWVLGTIVLMGYKITILSGLIPPVIVVIGIPNSIYLLNKYHHEYETHGNKMMAISRVTRKIGMVTLITNFTTAIGFLVLGFQDIIMLKEFGIVAGINIMATFVVSMILIPGVFSMLPPPSYKELKHLKLKFIGNVLHGLDLLVNRYKYAVFVVSGIIVLISLYGLNQVYSVSYMVDDIPEDSKIKQDLVFFENNFSGIMPLEIIVDTGVKKGVTNLKTLKKIEEFENFLQSHKDISKPVSVISFIKASRQAFYNNNPDRYDLPNNRDRSFIFRYFRNQSDKTRLLNSFVDSTGQIMRISLMIADIGSKKMDSLITQVIEPKKKAIFKDTKIQASITGTTLLFIKGNKFLIKNLQLSFLIAFSIISMIMALLFANLRMIIISLIPNIIPLLITGAIMGFFAIPLKPSTAIVFSIAFGISVDYSIHFLAKYRQELIANNFFVAVAVSNSLKETGKSMIYTSIVLFAGFIIFAASDFGGTVALGILTSTTLFIAMLANLIVLPSLLLAFDDAKRKKGSHPLIEQVDEFYQEDDDEEIDLGKIEVGNNGMEQKVPTK